MTPIGNINNMQLSIEDYKSAKIRMLEKEFMIHLKPHEREHFESLQTEMAVDRYARTILQSRWN